MNLKEKLQEKSNRVSVANRKLRNDQYESIISRIEERLNKAADRCHHYITLRTEISADKVIVIRIMALPDNDVVGEYSRIKLHFESEGLKVERKEDSVKIMW